MINLNRNRYFPVGRVGLLVTALIIRAHARPDSKLCFPKGFVFGVAAASHLSSGDFSSQGRGLDRQSTDNPDLFVGASGSRFAADVKLVRDLGVDFYRFSISWTKILPTGLTSEVSDEGIKYYCDLIEELRRNHIQPLATMHQWELPARLHALGGWTNPALVTFFIDYAKILFEAFGEKVNTWVTFQEPLSYCLKGYGNYETVGSSGVETYLCAHNVLRAHGMVYQLYKKLFQAKQKGNIGISLNSPWVEPSSSSQKDQDAAENTMQFFLGWFAHPIFSKSGNYPPIMRHKIDAISKRQGFSRSRLPVFTPAEVQNLRGSADFLGLNHYSTNLASRGNLIANKPSYYNDVGSILSQRPEWPKTSSEWLRVTPWGLRRILNWIRVNYNNTRVVVTENGVSSPAGLHDVARVDYLESYLRNLHAAVTQDGCNVLGHTYWSLMDYIKTERFGLYEVDFSTADLPRTPRFSASCFTKIATTKCL